MSAARRDDFLDEAAPPVIDGSGAGGGAPDQRANGRWASARPASGRRPGRRRVAVIGAGPGGLAASLLLARAGLDVVLFEKDEVPGGRTRTITAPGGYRFDLGPTFFLYPQILREIFTACGADLDQEVELRRLDPLYRLLFEDGDRLEVSGTPERLAAEIAKLDPADGANIGAFLADNRGKLESFKPALERPFGKITDMMTLEMLRSIPQLRPWSSVDTDLRRWFRSPKVRLAFSFQTKYLGMSPFRCPSLFTILSFLEHEHGIFHPIGGCGAVSEAMARVAGRMGVDVRYRAEVSGIAYENGRPRAVEVGGRSEPVDAVVIGADFNHAVRRLVPEPLRRRWPDRKLDQARISCSTFMLYLGIEGPLPDLAHHTILLSRDYRRNIHEIETGVLPSEPSLYVQHAGATDPSMAPPGHSALYVLVPVPNLNAGIDWRATAPAYRKIALDRMALMGLEGIEERIRYQRIVTPEGWSDQFAVGRGATFNLAHDFRQMLWFRPHNRFGPGTYLVGGGTHPGSGLPVIFEGARITARLVLEDLGMGSDVPGIQPSLAKAAHEPPEAATWEAAAE